MDNGLAICLGVLIGTLVLWLASPLQTVGVALGLVAGMAAIIKVEWGLLFLVFITHNNMSTVLIEQYGAPSIAKVLVPLLIVGIITRYACSDERPIGWGKLTLLILMYGLVGVVSMLYQAEIQSSLKALLEYGKDAIVAVIVILLLQRAAILRRVIWALLASGAFLGSIAFLQHLTGSYDNNYWGFALTPTHHIIDEIDGYRISGSLGDPNFFCMFQLVLVPLAVEQLLREQQFFLRLLAAYALAVIFFTVIFTYSRGGVVGLATMLAAFMMFYPRRAWLVVASVAIFVLLMQYSPQSNYINRMLTLEYLLPDKSHHPIAELSFQGRKSEMLVAVNILLDHPFAGIGFGSFERHYQKYARDVFLDFRREEREAHCRYLEILAETGLLGFTAYGLLIILLFRGLLQTRQGAASAQRQDLEGICIAMTISVVGLLTGFIFLHDAWPRFSWLLIGIGFAMPNILQNESERNVQTVRIPPLG